MVIGRVIALASRPSRATGLSSVDALEALAGAGLVDDVHADPLSPRQLLLAGAGVYAELALPAHALRENLLLDVDTAALRSGHILQIGDTVKIRLMFQCEACGQLNGQGPGLVRALGARRGMLARVLTGGTMRVGDPVRDLGPLLPAWSDDWHQRVIRVLDAVPQQQVIAYAQLARLAGVQSSYCRAFPSMLRKLGPAYAAKAVAQGADPSLPRWQGENLFDRL